MIHCPSCAQAVRPGAAFCGECGVKLPAEQPATPAIERSGFITLPPGVTPVTATNTGPAPSPISRTPSVPPPPPSSPPPAQVVPSSVPPVIAPVVVPSTTPAAPEAPPSLLPPAAEGADIDSTRVVTPRRSTVWSLVMPDGTAHAVTASAVIGRAPEPNAHGAVQSISVGVEQKSVSKSHALIEPTETGLRVRDLGSVNGVVVVHADGRESEATATRPVELNDGDELELGEVVLIVTKA